MKERMKWQKMVQREMAQIRARTVQHKKKEVCTALQGAASFHFLVEEWHDCEDLKPRIFVDKKRGS